MSVSEHGAGRACASGGQLFAFKYVPHRLANPDLVSLMRGPSRARNTTFSSRPSTPPARARRAAGPPPCWRRVRGCRTASGSRPKSGEVDELIPRSAGRREGPGSTLHSAGGAPTGAPPSSLIRHPGNPNPSPRSQGQPLAGKTPAPTPSGSLMSPRRHWRCRRRLCSDQRHGGPTERGIGRERRRSRVLSMSLLARTPAS